MALFGSALRRETGRVLSFRTPWTEAKACSGNWQNARLNSGIRPQDLSMSGTFSGSQTSARKAQPYPRQSALIHAPVCPDHARLGSVDRAGTQCLWHASTRCDIRQRCIWSRTAFRLSRSPNTSGIRISRSPNQTYARFAPEHLKEAAEILDFSEIRKVS